MPIYSLDQYSSLLLRRQGLEDFTFSFKPMYDRGNRRAKKGNSRFEALDPGLAPVLLKGKTVRDLEALFHKLAPATAGWIEGPRRYALQLYDDVGSVVSKAETLGDARQRPEARRRADQDHAAVVLAKAFDALEERLDIKDIPNFVRTQMKQRYGT